MKRIIPNIIVENCKDALEYYKEIFGGEIKNVQKAEGKEMFKGHEGKIVHAELHINEACILYLNDALERNPKESNISLMLQLESEEEINKLYAAVSEKGTVIFPLQRTFWGALHAVVTDCYGTTWSIDYSGR